MDQITERRRGKSWIGVMMIGIVMLVTPPVGRAAPPVLVPSFCPTGTAAGQCSLPRGLATNLHTGDIYVVEQENRRVQQFDAWGAVAKRTWGEQGTGRSQFRYPEGITTDSTGAVYVFEWENKRVQKFDAEGNFQLMFGGQVNETSGGNICPRPVFPADVCKSGVGGTANGFFTEAPEAGSYIAVGPGDNIYVGDKGRVQVFNSAGEFVKSIPLPAGETVIALAVDTFALSPSFGDIYVAYFENLISGNKEGVIRVSPTGVVEATLPATNPRAIATDASNGDVYVANKKRTFDAKVEFLRFDAAGKLLEAFGKGDLEESTGIATSIPSTCGLKGTDLIASNSDAGNSFVRIYGPPPSPGVCPPPAVAPEIEDQYASSVESSNATVRAAINPNFWTESTTYYIEYGTGKCSEGGCPLTKPVPPGASLVGPITNEALPVSVLLAGLAPDSTYHYRFVARSEGGGPVYGLDPDGEGSGEASFGEGLDATFHTFPAAGEPPADSCSNAAFRAGSSALLPDCRAYEMVSPVDKNGTGVFTGEDAQSQADEAGRGMTFTAPAAAGEPQGANLRNQYLASRVEGAGWESHSVQAPRNTISLYPLGSSSFKFQTLRFSPNLCEGWFIQDTTEALVEGAPSETPNLYRRELCDGGYELMTTVAPGTFKLDPFGGYYWPEPQGSSADGTKTVFRANDALTANAAPEVVEAQTYQLYLRQAGAPLRLVSVLPTSNASPGVASPLQTSVGTASPVLGQGSSTIDNVVGAVSGDGERVFWTAAPSGGTARTEHGGGPGTLYLRVNAAVAESAHDSAGKCTEAGKACTYKVSELISEAAAQFWQGNGKGTRALFSIGEKLYEFEASEAGGLLNTGATLIAEGFKGFMGASADTTRAYFVSTKALASGATAGKNNLYLYGKGSGFKAVGELSAADMVGVVPGINAPPSPVSPLPFKRSSRVSPDGLHAAFLSSASLTGFDNTDQANGKADAEAFLYDASANSGAGEVVCASCNAGGVRPLGRDINSTGEGQFFAAARIPGWQTEFQPSRVLSPDGSRFFFESFEGLVTRDTNGRMDVYQWEKASSRSECLEALRGELFLTESSGCLSLISSGQSSEDSEFFDATPSGNDVFFATLSSLVGQDTGLMDVYDARVNGGFPPPATPKASCEGEACQSPPAPPNDATPASSTYNGPGNVEERKTKKCAKGKVKKKGKCVKKKAKKKQMNKKAKTTGRAAR